MALQKYYGAPTRQPPEGVAGRAKPSPLTQHEYELFKGGFTNWKWLLVAKLLRSTGIRIAECLSLTGRQTQLDGPMYVLWIKRGKQTGSDRDSFDDVYLHPEFGMELKHFIAGNGIGLNDPVFQGRIPGQPVDRSAIWRACEQAGLKTLGRGVHPHELRKLYAASLLDQNVPLLSVSRMLGHTDTRTTARHYYDMNADTRRMIGESIRP